MELDIIKQQTTWNDAATSINSNFAKVKQAILLLESADAGLDEESLVKFLEENGYATEAYVATQISSILGGASSAYDTLKEIEDILEGNINSIDDILTAIATKAEKEDLAALELRVKAIEDAESEDMFAWADEEHTTIETEKNLVVKGDFSDAGVAGVVNIGVTSIVVDGVTYSDSDRDGVVDLTGAFENINVNLDNYYTKTEVYNKQETYSKDEVNDLIADGESDMFAWADEAKTTIKTEKNLIVEGELSDSGVAGNVTVGISTIRIDSKDYTDSDMDGIIDLTDALKVFDFNLEDYATKAEVSVISTNVNSLVSWKENFSKYIYIDEDDHDAHVDTNLIVSGDISDSGVGETPDAIGTVIGVEVNGVEYTDVTAGILDLSDAFNNVSVDLSDYYTIAQVDKKIDDLNVGQYATTDALTSGLKSKQDKISDLATIRNNASDGATAYKWGNHADAGYAKADSVASKAAFEALRNEFDALESALNDDVSGKINTWNEIVDFLDEYSGSQDLETILVGINADIAKRALQSDLDSLSSSVGNIQNTVKGHTSSIGSNASAIGVLQGFFTDGVANQASKVTNALAIVFNGTTYEFDGSAAKSITFSATNLVSALGATPVNRATADASGNTITSFYTPIATHNALVTKVSAAETNITNLTNNKADKATTLAGYGITDAYTKDEVDGKVTTINNSITTVSNRLAVVETWKNTLSEYIYVKDGLVYVTTDIIIGGDIATVADGEGGGSYASIGIIVGNSLAEYPNTAGVITLSKELITSGIGLGELAFKDSLTKSDVGLGNVTNLAASGYLTALSSDTTNAVSITVGGTTKSITAATMKTSLGLGSLAYKSSLVASDIPSLDWSKITSGKPTTLAGYGITDAVAYKRQANNFVFASNEWTVVPEGYSGELYLNYRTEGGLDGNITRYRMGNGSAGLASILAKSFKVLDGMSSQFLKADGSLDSTAYQPLSTAINTGNIGSQSVSYATSAGSATKLATARTIWGQSFDGTTNVTGSQYLPNQDATYFYDTAGNAINVLHFSNSNNLHLGYGNRTKGYNSFISGNNVYLYYGSGSQGFILNSSGNVTIGASDLAGTSVKLYVDGNARSTAEFISTNGKGIGFRTVNGGYGVFFQNGGSNCYLLTTAQNDAYGSYNSLRPFAFNLSTGAVTLGEKTTVSKLLTASGGVTIPSGQKLTIGSATIEWGSTYSSIDISNLVQFNGGIFIPTGKGLFIGDPSDGITLEYTGYGATLDGNLVPSINNYYNIGADNRYYKTVVANSFFSGSVSNNLWLICGENSGSTAIVFARASTSTDSKVEMGRIDSYGLTIEGDAIIKGDQATGSDIRFKNIIEDKVLDIKRIAEAPLFTFKWNDREDNTVHLGSSAQYWENVCPWLVNGEDFKTLNYATLGVAMGISLAKKTVNHEERIKELERKVESLETERD